MSRLEDYFLKESLLTEKEDDEIGPNARPVNSDSEASDIEGEGVKLAHAHDPAGPWARCADMPEPVRRAAMATHAREQTGQTGVKGVLADYKAHKREEQMQREREGLQRQSMLDRIANGATYRYEQEQPTIFDIANKAKQDDNDSEDDLLDDEFLEQYRAQRLDDLQSARNRPVFGEIKEVDKFAFVEEVDNADQAVYVVIHLYEEYIGACRQANKFLEQLAREYTSIKFLRMQSTQAKANYDQAVLPALLIYKGGDLVDSLFRITDDVGQTFTKEDLEYLLREALFTQ